MNEARKIAEADYFLERMGAETDNDSAFRHNLSAFLSASRSALQYALEEAETKPRGRVWFDGQMRSDASLKFLKDKRDSNIHDAPVAPNPSVTINESIDLSRTVRDSLTIRMIDKSEKLISVQHCKSPEPKLSQTPIQSSFRMQHFFADWPGPEDCLALCKHYLQTVRAVVKDGVAHGFLSGK